MDASDVPPTSTLHTGVEARQRVARASCFYGLRARAQKVCFRL